MADKANDYIMETMVTWRNPFCVPIPACSFFLVYWIHPRSLVPNNGHTRMGRQHVIKLRSTFFVCGKETILILTQLTRILAEAPSGEWYPPHTGSICIIFMTIKWKCPTCNRRPGREGGNPRKDSLYPASTASPRAVISPPLRCRSLKKSRGRESQALPASPGPLPLQALQMGNGAPAGLQPGSEAWRALGNMLQNKGCPAPAACGVPGLHRTGLGRYLQPVRPPGSSHRASSSQVAAASCLNRGRATQRKDIGREPGLFIISCYHMLALS